MGYLSQDKSRTKQLQCRLAEAFGVSPVELANAQAKIDTGEWRCEDLAAALDKLLLDGKAAPSSLQYVLQNFSVEAKAKVPMSCTDGRAAYSAPSANPVLEYLEGHAPPVYVARPCHKGPPGHAAMPPRVRDRKAGFQTALPTLAFCCRMCEAEFPNRRAHDEHVDMVHGGSRWYINAFHSFHELHPYVVSPTENRSSVQRFARAQQYGTKEFDNEPYVEEPPKHLQKLFLWDALYTALAVHGSEDHGIQKVAVWM